MKKINTYVLVVDTHRKPSMRRNTYGRYLVGAKSEKEAVKLLRKAIGFGSIKVSHIDTEQIVNYKTVTKEIFETTPDGITKVKHVKPTHATQSQKKK